MISPTAPRVAVVGAGPRAAFALERLATLSVRHGVSPPHVDVIAPGSDLGPGQVYAPDQPHWLRLNVPSSAVHAWRGGADPADRDGGPSLDEWRERREPGSTADQFPARALVGHYLAEVGHLVRSRVPGRRLTGRVTSMCRGTGVWELRGDAARQYDELLLAPGHADDWSGALRNRWESPVPLAPDVFPVARLRTSVPDRDGVVVVRGAALTAIDALLALTRGRSHAPRVVLASRTGRLMTPKPEPRVLAAIPGWDPFLATASRRLSDLDVPVDRVLLDTARALYDVSRRSHHTASRPRAIEAAVESLTAPVSRANHAAWLREQLAIASGEAAPDGSWALGQAWRGLYPALVARQERLAGTDQPPLGWSAYPCWAPGLERLAFGPPPVNARYLLEMLETGQVEVRTTSSVADLAHERRAVAVVDAVLAPPGLRDTADPLLRQLLASGAVSVHARSRGMRITPSAQCLGADGTATPGLSAVGRVTEDVVLGNDTLVRTHHGHLDRWARRVLGLPEGSRRG